MPSEEVYEVFALKYAERKERTRRESFIFADLHDQPHPIDYFIWVIRSQARTIVVDTGFGQAEANARERTLLREPRQALAMMDLDAAAISDVIITHMHYDHAGSLEHFPTARFHLQESEMAYVTGPCMCFDELRHPFTAEHVCQMIGNLYSGRVSFANGDAEIAPNLTVHRIGGHTGGIQCVRVLTKRGWVVLASDVSHFYENFEQKKMFPIVLNAREMLEGFVRLEQLADSQAHVVPGHDPLVCARYPVESTALDGVVYRLDVAPEP